MSAAGTSFQGTSAGLDVAPGLVIAVPADESAPLRSIARLPARVLLLLIRGYQRFVSPALPVITMGACACRFAPTCSVYAAEAVRTHGAWAGSWLAVRRLLKCTPLHPGGIDLVPPPRPRRACRTVQPSA